MHNYTVGLDMGGTKIALGLFDEQKKLIAKTKFKTDHELSSDALFDETLQRLEGFMRKNGASMHEVTGIGIGAPAVIERQSGLIRFCPNIPAIQGANIREYFIKKTGIRTVVDNDANVAALAEHLYGAGIGFPHMIYSTASTGIGGGIIINGRLFRGSYGFAGEIGHMIANTHHGQLCGCKNRGCFESWAGGAHIFKHVAERIKQGESTLMLELAQGDVSKITGEILYQAYLQKDPMSIALLDQIAYYFGLMFFNLYLALNINCYVVGGGLTHFGDDLLSRIENAFSSFHIEYPMPVYIKYALLDQDFGIIGAMELLNEST